MYSIDHKQSPLFGKQPVEKLGKNEDIDFKKSMIKLPNGTGKWIMIGLGLAVAATVTVAVIYLFQSGILSNTMQNVSNLMPTQMPSVLSKMVSFVQTPGIIEGVVTFAGTFVGLSALAGVTYVGHRAIKGVKSKIKEHREKGLPDILRYNVDPLDNEPAKPTTRMRSDSESPVYDGL